MPSSFLNTTLQALLKDGLNLAETTFVLPSKRAGSFLKELLKTQTDYAGFAPQILSIEEFIVDITGLQTLDNTNSIFRFYEVYKETTPKGEQEDFETFLGWAQTLIYDFNEIDRYLIPTEAFFSYLSDIQEIDHWALADPQTDMVSNYLKFWRQLPTYHTRFVRSILADDEAYQGLIYRRASEEIEAYLKKKSQEIIFVGFNALNNAEQKIIQTVLDKEKGQVFWDLDHYFFEDKQHEAGLFIRNYKEKWPYFKNRELKGLSDFYSTVKTIKVLGISKNIGQAKAVGQILKEEKLDRTAVVLNDEGLLIPLLNSLPQNVKKANVTMGLTLGMTPPAALFDILFKIQKSSGDAVYYKEILDVLSHPTFKLVYGDSTSIEKYLIQKNHVFIGVEKLKELALTQSQKQLIELCFTDYKDKAGAFLQALFKIIESLRPNKPEEHQIETEYLFHFQKVFTKLHNLLERFGTLTGIATLQRLYQDLLQTENIDFEGSPFQGLQIMGMLESRVLDFDTVILTSVNEGILPSGKSTNSFVPYDLKRQYKLPTYKEKDAVYTYHFYRLLQRAKKVYILYNTEKSGLNAGEKSRFITQLEVERPKALHFYESVQNQTVGKVETELKEIPKSPEIIKILKRQAERGFSPSALTSYIRNPIDFYKNYILGIKDSEEVEETVAYNTLGTVVHGVLEDFYKPLVGQYLTRENLKSMQNRIETEVTSQFLKEYSDTPLDRGKNLIIKEVAKRFVHNFLKDEQKAVEAGNAPKILMVESEQLQQELAISELDFPVKIRGKVDRVDEVAGQLRIVDYKTGKVENRELGLKDWEELIADYKYSKAFQVLCYASMYLNQSKYNTAQAGIISFKNRKAGFMNFKFGTKKNNDFIDEVNDEALKPFYEVLKTLILEIFNPDVPFIEKEIDQKKWS